MRKTGLIKSVLPVVLFASSFACAALPVIKDFSSKGGHTQNKTGPKDRMYLVKPGDKITFTVQADGAEKYVWQVGRNVHEVSFFSKVQNKSYVVVFERRG